MTQPKMKSEVLNPTICNAVTCALTLGGTSFNKNMTPLENMEHAIRALHIFNTSFHPNCISGFLL